MILHDGTGTPGAGRDSIGYYSRSWTRGREAYLFLTYLISVTQEAYMNSTALVRR
jgi:hypothetical protein